MAYILILLGVIILDRVVKWLVYTNMDLGQTIPIIDNIFHITYIRNTGAAFSIMEGQSAFLIGLPILFIVAAIVFMFIRRKSLEPMLCVALCFICGGGLGNLIDRIAIGYVVDMFDFRVFPVFNVADIFVCMGCGLLILYVLIGNKKGDKDGR
jgi:signal peptidase II